MYKIAIEKCIRLVVAAYINPVRDYRRVNWLENECTAPLEAT